MTDKRMNMLLNGDLAEWRAWEAELRQEAAQESLKLLPVVIDNIIKQSATLKDQSNKFYSEHSDLKAHKELVAKTIEQLEAANPGKSPEKLLELAAASVRKQLTNQSKAKTSDKRRLAELDDFCGKL